MKFIPNTVCRTAFPLSQAGFNGHFQGLASVSPAHPETAGPTDRATRLAEAAAECLTGIGGADTDVTVQSWNGSLPKDCAVLLEG